MTAILGLKHEGKVYLAGDRSANDNEATSTLSSPKVFAIGEYALGFCGGFTPGQILASNWRPPTPKRDFSKFRSTLLQSIRECLEDSKANLKGTDMLIGCRGKLYHLQEDWSLLPQRSAIVGIGTGGAWAEAAAAALLPYASKLKLNPKPLLNKALSIAARHSIAVRKPFDVVVV